MRRLCSWVGFVLALPACAATSSSDSSGAAGGGTGAGAAGGGGSGGSGPIECVPAAGLDQDADGFTPEQGDCDDCDPLLNPDAAEVIAPPSQDGDPPVFVDEDCDGLIDNVPTCDQDLLLESLDPEEAARAIGVCDFLTSAKWVLADGADVPADAEAAGYHLGHGILPSFGPMHPPLEGQRMLALSSGAARREADPGFVHRNLQKGYECEAPEGFPKETASCPGISTGTPGDAAALELVLTAPSNAQSFEFEFNFFTYEWPQFICTEYNDQFVTILEPFPSGQLDGNISFDSEGNAVSVNNGYLQSCGCLTTFCQVPPPPNDVKTFTCPLGTQGLEGTDFAVDDVSPDYSNGSTGWLRTTAPVQPGQTIHVRFAIYDSGDFKVDSTVLVDNWAWSTKPVRVETIPE